jgi:hypothetical protein
MVDTGEPPVDTGALPADEVEAEDEDDVEVGVELRVAGEQLGMVSVLDAINATEIAC